MTMETNAAANRYKERNHEDANGRDSRWMRTSWWAACLAVFASLTVGCVASSPGGGSQAAAPAGSDYAAGTSDGGSAAGGNTPTTEFDYQAYLRRLEEASGIKDPPHTKMIRLVSADEQLAVLKDCLAEAGFQVTVTFDGGLEPPRDLPSSQVVAYQRAEYVCYAEYPVDPSTFPPPLNETEIEILYDYYVNDLMPCLEDHGYDVPSPPPMDAFKDEFATGQDLWFPYDSVPAFSLTDEKWEEINRDCPQAPSDEVLYSDR